jgi:hypothetical protein
MNAMKALISLWFSLATLGYLPEARAADASGNKPHVFICYFQGPNTTDLVNVFRVVSNVFTDTRSSATVTQLWQAWLRKHLPTSSPSGYMEFSWNEAPQTGVCDTGYSVPEAEKFRAGYMTSGLAHDWLPPGPTVHVISSKVLARYWVCAGALAASKSGGQKTDYYVTSVFEIPFVVSTEDVTARFKAYFAAQHPDPDRLHGQECGGAPTVEEAQRYRGEKMSTVVPPSNIDFDYNDFKLGGPRKQ